MSDESNYMPPLSEDDDKTIEEIQSFIQDWLDSLKVEEQRIDEIKARIKKSKDELAEAISQITQETEFRLVKSMATSIYWNMDEPCVRRGLAMGLGLNAKTPLGGHVYNAFYSLRCGCGKEYRSLVKSLTKLNVLVPALCPDCRRKLTETSNARREEKYHAHAEELAALKSMPYPEYLKTEHWAETRKLVLKRAGYRCQTCNAKGELHVHHNTYKRRGEENMADLVVLCADCHKTFHDNHGVNNE